MQIRFCRWSENYRIRSGRYGLVLSPESIEQLKRDWKIELKMPIVMGEFSDISDEIIVRLCHRTWCAKPEEFIGWFYMVCNDIVYINEYGIHMYDGTLIDGDTHIVEDEIIIEENNK